MSFSQQTSDSLFLNFCGNFETFASGMSLCRFPAKIYYRRAFPASPNCPSFTAVYVTKSRAHLYRRFSPQTERSSLARGVWATAKFTAFLAVVCIAGWFFFQDQVRSRLCSVVQEKADEALLGSGVETAIGEARFFDGQGMLLTNVKAMAPNISLTAYETFVAMPINTAQLVSGKIDLDSVEMRRVQIEVTQSANQPIDWSMFAELAQALKNPDQETPRLIPISILDSQIKFVDRRLRRQDDSGVHAHRGLDRREAGFGQRLYRPRFWRVEC